MPRSNYLIFLVLAFAFELSAQSIPDSAVTTPFQKGRTLVGLSGNIRSSKFDNNSILPSDKFINEYSFEINLGKFIADKNLIGLVFTTTRDQSVGYINIEKEIVTLGPQYKLYFGKKPDMGLHVRAVLLWAYYIENSTGLQGVYFVDESIKGQGIGGDLGFGYTYVIADKVAFEIGFSSMLAYFKGDFTDNYLGTSEALTFNKYDYRFTFGFNILFNRLKDD